MPAYTQEDLAEFAETIRVLERARAEDQALIAALTAEAAQAHANNARLKQRILELEGETPPAQGGDPRSDAMAEPGPPAPPPPAAVEVAPATPPADDPTARSDLDGTLLTGPEGGLTWLVFLGRRHPIVDQAVLETLFAPGVQPTVSHDLHRLPEGALLGAEARLVRAPGSPIYLARTGLDGPVLHHIPSWETFQEFSFDIDQVREVPRLLLDALRQGPVITGARTR